MRNLTSPVWPALLAGGLLIALLSSCSAASSGATTQQTADAASGTEGDSSGGSADSHTLLKSGFGVDGDYAWAGALVRNDSKNSGATVVVNFNLVDATGEIVASQSQTEAFSYPGQELAIGTQIEVPKRPKVSKVEVTVDVEYPCIGPTAASEPLTFSRARVVKQQYGTGYEISSTVTNPTDQAIKNARVGILCYNARGRIIGGSSTYPQLIPPNGRTKVKQTVITSGKPSSCDLRGPTDSGF